MASHYYINMVNLLDTYNKIDNEVRAFYNNSIQYAYKQGWISTAQQWELKRALNGLPQEI